MTSRKHARRGQRWRASAQRTIIRRPHAVLIRPQRVLLGVSFPRDGGPSGAAGKRRNSPSVGSVGDGENRQRAAVAVPHRPTSKHHQRRFHRLAAGRSTLCRLPAASPPIHKFGHHKAKAAFVHFHQPTILGRKPVISSPAHPFRLVRKVFRFVRSDETRLAKFGADLLGAIPASFPPIVILRGIGQPPAFPAKKPPASIQHIAGAITLWAFEMQAAAAEVCWCVAVGNALYHIFPVAAVAQLSMVLECVISDCPSLFAAHMPPNPA